MSQEELARIVNVNLQHISNIETGRKAPSVTLLVKIANALDVSADDLLTDSLKHSSSPVDTKIHDLLLECNNKEEEALIKIVSFLKAFLVELGI